MLKGIIYVIIGSLLFGITPLGNNYMIKDNMAPECLIMYQSVIMAFFSLIFAKLNKANLKISIKNIILLMLIGAFGIGFTDLFLDLGYVYMPVSYVMIIHFLYPTIVLLISVIIFKEKLNKYLIISMILCILGVILISNPKGEITLLGIIFAFLSALVYGLYLLLNDHTKVGKIDLFIKLFYGSIATFFIYLIVTLYQNSLIIPLGIKSNVILFFISGIATLFGFYFITKGIKYIGATKTAFINMLEPIIAVFGGILVFKDSLTIYAIIGCVFILLSILFVTINSKKD